MFSEGGTIISKSVTDALNESFKVAIPASTGHLTPLSASNIKEWRAIRDRFNVQKSATQSLDLLYNLTNGK